MDANGHPLAADFLSFWSAGHLALGGHAAQAYDWSIMHALQGRIDASRDRAAFSAGPIRRSFFAVAMFLALLPFGMAFLGLGRRHRLALYAAAIARIARDRRAALLALAAPASSGLRRGGAEWFSHRRPDRPCVLLQLEARPLLAGSAAGASHLQAAFRIALSRGVALRRLLDAPSSAAAIATLAILFVSWLAAPDSLAAFAAHLGGMSNDFLSQGHAGFYKLQSLYGLLRMLGVADGASFTAQGAVARWRWQGSSPGCGETRRMSRSEVRWALRRHACWRRPISFLYDFPVLSIAIAFLWRARPFDRIETILLLLSQLAIAGFVMVSMRRWVSSPLCSRFWSSCAALSARQSEQRL